MSNFKDILYNEIIIPFKTLTVEQIAKKIIDILAVETLQLMKNTLVSILNIIRDYTLRAIESIHKPIDFPVISWLYKKYVGSTLTCLDVVCLVCAVPATIAYKAATNTAPFKKDDPLTNNLINARDLATFQALLASTVSNNSQQTNRDTPPQNILAKNIAVFLGGLATIPATAVMIINNNFLVKKVLIDGYQVLAGDTPQILKLNVYNAIATIFYVSPNLPGTADTDHWYQKMNTAFTYGTIVKALAGLVFNGDKSTLALNCVEGIMNFAWNAPVIANIVQEKDNATYFGLIPESIADFSFNIGGMLTPAIQILAKRPPQGPAIAAVLYFGQKITMGVYSGGIAISGLDKLVRTNGS